MRITLNGVEAAERQLEQIFRRRARAERLVELARRELEQLERDLRRLGEEVRRA